MPAPADDELEVTVLGPGIGESIVFHAGSGYWGVIDSCFDPETGRPAALAYLDSIGVGYANIRLVMATHCDQDHTIGLAQVINAAAPNAIFAVPAAFTERSFRELVSISTGHLGDTSELKYLGDVLRAIEQRGDTPTRCQANLVLHEDNAHGLLIKALSPSNAEIHSSLSWVAQQTLPARSGLQVTPPSPNNSSIAVLMISGRHRWLFGADVERNGWQAILQAQGANLGVASFLKVPHHGSPGAHWDPLWANHLQLDAKTALTAYARGTTQRPNHDDIRRICGLRSESFATSLPRTSEFSETYGREIDRAARRAGATPRTVISRTCGRITLRVRKTEPISTARVSLANRATPLCGRAAA